LNSHLTTVQTPRWLHRPSDRFLVQWS